MTLTPEQRRLLAELPALRAIAPHSPRRLEAEALLRQVRAHAASRDSAIAGMTLRAAHRR